jgi:shikimate kinase
MKGITLIGMPGAGKSTIGRQLAGRLNWQFIDLDLILEENIGQKLAEFIKEKGEQAFLDLEEKSALKFNLANAVFSPGGSIVYCSKAMKKIKQETAIFFLDLPVEEIKKRLGNNPETRGIIGLASKGLENLFEERRALYKKYSDYVIFCQNGGDEEIIEKILNLI